MQEELNETIEALWKSINAPPPFGNTLQYTDEAAQQEAKRAAYLAEIADGVGDLIWVAMYTAALSGIDMEPVWAEIKRTNMAKIGGGFDKNGKLMKPAGWQPPDIHSIIKEQMQHGS